MNLFLPRLVRNSFYIVLVFCTMILAQSKWTQVNPISIGSCLKSVFYINNQFVGCNNDNLFTSSDGIIWKKKSKESFSSLIFVEDKYIGLKQENTNGDVYISYDCVKWSPYKTGMGSHLCSIIYGGKLIVAVGDNGGIATSSDGIKWNCQKVQIKFEATDYLGGSEEPDLLAVAYGNRQYVAVGKYGLIYSSSDGIAWQWRESQSKNGNSINENDINAIVYTDSMFFAVDNKGFVVSSIDGIEWAYHATPTSQSLHSIMFSDKLIAVGDGCIISSSNGVDWTIPNYKIGGSSIAYGRGVYIICGNATLTSDDGLNWITRQSDVLSKYKLCFGNDNFIAIGNEGSLFSSTDSKLWSSHYVSGGLSAINDIVFANNQFYAFGDKGKTLTSTNGINWEDELVDFEANFQNVAFGNNMFLALNEYDILYQSNDGVEWTQNKSINDGVFNVWELYSIVFHDNMFAIGARRNITNLDQVALIITSQDGQKWVFHESTILDEFHSIVYGKNKYVAIGDNGSVLISQDGTQWNKLKTNISENLSSLIYCNGQYLVSGDNGAIYVSYEDK